MASVQVSMDVPLETVWQVCTDIEHCAEYIESIVGVDIVAGKGGELQVGGARMEGGGEGGGGGGGKGVFAEGLTWDETRVMFGSQAKERMWVESVQEKKCYVVGAESCGAKYETQFEFEQVSATETHVRCSFDAKALTCCAWFMNLIMAPLMASAMKKALVKDLQDIEKEAKRRMKDK
eukprot:CAMPEP_0181318662 /NCGR_PEP_ID=MMETSP1101-20121128/17128_1 /TAXON_ID=46948 /ORGANISM="Rhodomonas abbreviata, Strain Caron Lab Isolate" /LENGTH=177 /DNA_ID=CAMNT_0023426151 /DNA_START=24 /DNA_END=557 /DNA_ORIENTATION=+